MGGVLTVLEILNLQQLFDLHQTLSKELQALVKLGAIRLRYGHIEIQDMALLLDASEAGAD